MRSTLLTIENMFSSSDKVALSNFIGRFGPDSFLVLIFILISPNLIPFLSQFGIAELTSGMVCLISLQLMTGREMPWLPQKMANREMSCKKIAIVGDRVFPVLYKLDLLTQPRLKMLSDVRMYRFYGLMFFILAMLILLPLPFFNYAPAVVIMLSVIGLLNRDGFFLLAGLSMFMIILTGLTFTLAAMIM
ncbi:MAG: hypothetical protein DI586_06350 [Micavibrio aeruginosavorus]|uniref:Exopolysaccharide biosynthesis protein n=1 Tax=Micavibrio aeruginosavorus TaxID=349221 RepID=A0A2W5HIV5_9BACT|nr:MAG: hypothetical protein DI586_06350 [Micavibrio aeruginosavorus]